MSGVITDDDRRRWHLRGAKTLASVLQQGYDAGLPVLHWSVNMFGDLIADVRGLGSTPTRQRAEFNAWCAFLDGRRSAERTDPDGTAHLHAVFTWRDNDLVKGTIRAVIWPEHDSEPA